MHIPNLIMKLHLFYLFNTSYFPYDRQNGSRFSKSNGRDKEFEYTFLIICRYLNLVKNQRLTLLQLEN